MDDVTCLANVRKIYFPLCCSDTKVRLRNTEQLVLFIALWIRIFEFKNGSSQQGTSRASIDWYICNWKLRTLSGNIFEQFHNEGYLVVKNFLSDEDVASLKTAIGTIIDEFQPDQHRSVFTTSDTPKQVKEFTFSSQSNSGTRLLIFWSRSCRHAMFTLWKAVTKFATFSKRGRWMKRGS